MANDNYSEMSNSEIKLCIAQIKDEWEVKKNRVQQLCEELEALEKSCSRAELELNIRKNIQL